MIVTGGLLRGRRLKVPAGDRVRPTPARAKEALFSILSAQLPEAMVLDCFAGSGALGIEALSRGAAFAAFIEDDPRVAATLRATLAEFKIDEASHVYRGRAEKIAPGIDRQFSLVFADPPYAQLPPVRLFDELQARGRLTDDATLIYEHPAAAHIAEWPGFTISRRETWGEVGMIFLHPRANDGR